MRVKGSLVLRGILRTAVSVVAVVLAAVVTLPASGAEWLTYRNGLERHNCSSEKFTAPLSLVWKFTTAASNERVPPVVTRDRVFCAAGSHMQALDLATGASLWDYDAGDTILAPATYTDGRLVFGADNGKIVCLNAADGKEAWVVSTTLAVRAAPAVVGGAVYVASLDRRVMALDLSTGAQRWAQQLTDELWGALAVMDNMVYVPSADGQFFGLDSADGRIRMQLTMTPRRALMHPAVIAEDAIYLAGRSDLRGLSLRGSQRWQREFGTFVTGAPALGGGRLYLALIDGRVLALDLERGRTLWQFDFNADMAAPPTVVGEVVVAGAAGGLVYGLDAASGRPRWRYEGQPPGVAAGSKASFNLAASPVYSNGSLYLMWDDGTLARFDVNASDMVPPTIRLLTPSENMVTGTKLPKTIGAQVFDEESGLDMSSLAMKLDGAPVDAKYDPYTGYFTYTITEKGPTGPLKTGWHTVSITARDQRGNEVSKSWGFVAQPGAETEPAQTSAEQPAQTSGYGPQPGPAGGSPEGTAPYGLPGTPPQEAVPPVAPPPESEAPPE